MKALLSRLGPALLAGAFATLPPAAAATDEIVVTARKKDENLQEVPISISAFTSERLNQLGLNSNYDVAAYTPNFSTTQRAGRGLDRPVVRGMANPPDKGEPNASYFIDGIYMAGSISTLATNVVESVEILRGPQSAQFGRATFSGAVNYVTRQPTNDFESAARLRYGSSEEREVSGWISGPLIDDTLRFLLSVGYDEYGGQWRNNLRPDSAFIPGTLFTFVFNGQNPQGDTTPLGQTKTLNVLGKLVWNPSDTSEVELKYSFTEGDDSDFPAQVPTNPVDSGGNVINFANLNCFLPTDPGDPWYMTSVGEYCGEFSIAGTENRKNLPDLRNGMNTISIFAPLPPEQRFAQPVKPGQRRDTHRVLGQWTQEYGDWSSSLKLGYSTDNYDRAYDLDMQEARALFNLFANNVVTDIKDQSAELVLYSPQDHWLRGSLGVYYYHQQRAEKERFFTGPAAVFGAPPGTQFDQPRRLTIENKSVFGSVSADLGETVTLDVEARYASDAKRLRAKQYFLDTPNTSVTTTNDLSFRAFTPRISLSWKPGDDLLVYGLAAKGNKPGDFNDNLFRSDVVAEYSNFLLSCTPGDQLMLGGFFPIDCTQSIKDDLIVKEEENWTYEAGVKGNWLDGKLTANLALFYVDWENQSLLESRSVPAASRSFTIVTVLRNAGKTRIKGFELESRWQPNDIVTMFLNYGYSDGEFREGSLPSLAATIGGDGSIVGKTVPDTPKHLVIAGFSASRPVSANIDGFFSAEYLYESKKFHRSSNHNWIGSRNLVNFRTGLEAESWSLSFYVRNLFNDDTPLTAFGPFPNYVNDAIDTGVGSANTGSYPLLYGLNPQRARDAGLELRMSW